MWKIACFPKTPPPRKHRYTLTDTGIDENIDGHWFHRYILNYKGKVTSTIVASYFIDKKGRKDTTVLRYNFDTNTTTLLKLPCGSEK